MQKEPIDIAYIKGTQYLLGCFDGSLMLKDVAQPDNDITFEQHLRNRATWIRSIIIDCDRKVWIGTSNGLTVYSRNFKIIRQLTPYDDKVKFFGHFRIMWTDRRRRYIFWWCDRGSIKVFDARTLKIVAKFRDMLKHPDERPNHYTFLDGTWRKVFFVTNHQANIGVYYVLDVCRRKVFGGEAILPKSSQNRLFAHICIAYNCPSDCIVTTGVSSLIAGDPHNMESKEEISHMSVFKLLPNNTVQLVDFQLNSELKLMTIASVVFHSAAHTRILSVLTKHVYIIDLVRGKLQVLFKIRDINKGECVHQLVRTEDYFLFVGNYGQIFRIDFNPIFFEEGALTAAQTQATALLAAPGDVPHPHSELHRPADSRRMDLDWPRKKEAGQEAREYTSQDLLLAGELPQRTVGPVGSRREKKMAVWPTDSQAPNPKPQRLGPGDLDQPEATMVDRHSRYGGFQANYPAHGQRGLFPYQNHDSDSLSLGSSLLNEQKRPQPKTPANPGTSTPTASPQPPKQSEKRSGKKK